ncbi:CHAD domain-containing protein [Vulcanococcus sp.]|uniref:CHAD domain-containing protein n=1 Tax=Vulcanococcus sp. TaxID=2856995 RepID=UPI00323F810D
MELSVYLQDLLQATVKQLIALQASALAGSDPEPLHQLRIQLRRLALLLELFEPVARWPEGVSSSRAEKVCRRLGMARDLDVLRDRLEHVFLPQLPEDEINALKGVRKQLKRERRLAIAEVEDALRGRRYLKLLARLQAWLKEPRFTSLGSEPLDAWMLEFHAPLISDLFLLPGWRSESASDLHQLRQRLKRCRYGLALSPGPHLLPWLAQLKRSQQLLGELNDLHVFELALDAGRSFQPDVTCPVLTSLVASQRQVALLQWRDLAAQWSTSSTRLSFHQALLAPVVGGLTRP